MEESTSFEFSGLPGAESTGTDFLEFSSEALTYIG